VLADAHSSIRLLRVSPTCCRRSYTVEAADVEPANALLPSLPQNKLGSERDAMDLWLLGRHEELVSEYGGPQRFSQLNALEKCLLAATAGDAGRLAADMAARCRHALRDRRAAFSVHFVLCGWKQGFLGPWTFFHEDRAVRRQLHCADCCRSGGALPQTAAAAGSRQLSVAGKPSVVRTGDPPSRRQAAAAARLRFDVALQAGSDGDDNGVSAQLEAWKQDAVSAGGASCCLLIHSRHGVISETAGCPVGGRGICIHQLLVQHPVSKAPL